MGQPTSSCITELPAELIMEIAQYCDNSSLCNWMRSGKYIYMAINHPETGMLEHEFNVYYLLKMSDISNLYYPKIGKLKLYFGLSMETLDTVLKNNLPNVSRINFMESGIRYPSACIFENHPNLHICNVRLRKCCPVFNKYHNRFKNVYITDYKDEQTCVNNSITKLKLNTFRYRDKIHYEFPILEKCKALEEIYMIINHMEHPPAIVDFSMTPIKKAIIDNHTFIEENGATLFKLPKSCKHVHLNTHIIYGELGTKFEHPEWIETMTLHFYKVQHRSSKLEDPAKFAKMFCNLKTIYYCNDRLECLKGYYFKMIKKGTKYGVVVLPIDMEYWY